VPIDDPRVILTTANLRDLGGLPTSDGWTVRTGRLFRSGHLCDLDDAGLSVVGALGVRTIVDLRRPVEIAERPHPDVPGAELIHCQVSDDDNEFAVVANMLDDAEGTIDGPAAVEDYFRRNVDGRLDAYRPVFRLATDPARLPLLFNCTAGKDRTGFVAAVLLRLLGVDEATLNEVIDSGLPFMTSGCPSKNRENACNRPFSNCTPYQAMIGELRNYPFKPTAEDVAIIRRQLADYSDVPVKVWVDTPF